MTRLFYEASIIYKKLFITPKFANENNSVHMS